MVVDLETDEVMFSDLLATTSLQRQLAIQQEMREAKDLATSTRQELDQYVAQN